MRKQSPRTVRLRLVVVELDAEFSDDEPPSLSGVAVVETDAADDSRPLAKCEGFPWRKAGGAK